MIVQRRKGSRFIHHGYFNRQSRFCSFEILSYSDHPLLSVVPFEREMDVSSMSNDIGIQSCAYKSLRCLTGVTGTKGFCFGDNGREGKVIGRSSNLLYQYVKQTTIS